MVVLTMKEKGMLEVVQRVMSGQISIGEAGRVLGRVERTVYRMVAKVRLQGVEGIIHGNRLHKRKIT